MKSLGDRMKNNYENRSRHYLTRRTPVIMRLDGKAFHTLTRGCDKPFDKNLFKAMQETAIELCKSIQGAKCAYQQSDEITILITDYDTIDTDAWFDYNIQKMTSISAAMVSVNFTRYYGKIGIFDSRVFSIPKEEVCNNFIWRQQDWLRNSLQMVCRSHFSHKEMENKKTEDMHEMLHKIGVNWATDFDTYQKNGSFIIKNDKGWNLLDSTPVFTEDRSIIEKLVDCDVDCDVDL